ncbi:hypothetical protein FSP39_018255 [Pinctada imbricata]|uniref:CCHC-type domain-containing protein n=1 Tax=Pinctada imbricata TaxID=66713 RepID=A0AA88XJL7_PINIB|nr:hypothetical protein FSP39_018255 [Pinctada imbricata]
MQCYNCWDEGHKSSDCKNEQKCRVCLKTAHNPGSPECEFYTTAKNVVVFKGKDNPISNFFQCEIRVFGENHQSAEHAFQLTKAIRAGNLEAADKVRTSKTALDAKRVGNTIRTPDKWETEQYEVMENIIYSKAEQVDEFRTKLESCGANSTFAEATVDSLWGTGLDVKATLHTDPLKWPGKNELGKIVKKVSVKYARKVRSASVPRKKSKHDESQKSMEKFIRDLRRGRTKRNIASDSGESDLSTHE